ncbi:hypothetical protein [Halobacillus hunanensis]|uniref:hypothetical protein n=1 Tax=Halobacillus hunanensis TaxID=578214 RepID=UPI0011171C6C|nr:hypothetical protein [Halobacillus hunanensis]
MSRVSGLCSWTVEKRKGAFRHDRGSSVKNGTSCANTELTRILRAQARHRSEVVFLHVGGLLMSRRSAPYFKSKEAAAFSLRRSFGKLLSS